MYSITATLHVEEEDSNGNLWNKCVDLPTFYLNVVAQGILNRVHAESIAHEILTAANADAEFTITAWKV